MPEQSNDLIYSGILLFASATSGFVVTKKLIPVIGQYLLRNTNLHGCDYGRKDKSRIPESLGIVAGLVYLFSYLLFFVMIPTILSYLGLISDINLTGKLCSTLPTDETHGYSNSLSNLAAITSIFAMLILGFLDDCYDLRWRYKLIFPCAASLPLLSIYYYSYGDRTTILVPELIARYLNIDTQLELGIFYYIYMLMFVIFCTNAINIYAGINGIEVGQTIVWTMTILLYNLVEITTQADCDDVHALSLKLLIPFLACISALYSYNRYPAKVFVGDSYCYFAGITIAVVGVIGHFSEETLAFAIPQVFNFLLSVPQLFKFVPCPRHRLPKLNEETGLREPSTFEFQYNEINLLGRLLLKIYSLLGFAKIRKITHLATRKALPHTEKNSNQIVSNEDEDNNGSTKEKLLTEHNNHNNSQAIYSCNNLTLINLWLSWYGPMNERDLCHQLLILQSRFSFLVIAMLTYIKIGANDN